MTKINPKYFEPKRYMIFIFTKFIDFFSWILSPLNNYLLTKNSSLSIKYDFQPIFIVGAPRTGSTALYQEITDSLDVLYFNNIVKLFYRIPLVALKFSRAIFGDKPHFTKESTYGNTKGYNAPAECGEFWYQWFSKDEYFSEVCEHSSEDLSDIKQIFNAMQTMCLKPIVIKNLALGQRLRVISKIFPNARIIYLKRDIYYTAQSILNARKKLGIPENTVWSIRPKSMDMIFDGNVFDLIINQIQGVEKQIEEDLILFDKINVLKIRYEDFNEETMDSISKKFNLKIKPVSESGKMLVKNVDSCEPAERIGLRNAISKINREL